MTKHLVRYQQTGHLHFVTFSCHARRPYLSTDAARNTFERALTLMRSRYSFLLHGYVVMPDHVHLLLSEPIHAPLAKALQAIKLSVAFHRPERPFWQKRYYDFNVYSERKRTQKLTYMHRNPVARGLVRDPGDWAWSSYRQYVLHEQMGDATAGAPRLASETWASDRAELISGSREALPHVLSERGATGKRKNSPIENEAPDEPNDRLVNIMGAGASVLL
jgi:putative transposase